MSRPWWWYALQIPGVVCFALIIPLIFLSLPGWDIIPERAASFLVSFLTFGIGWGFGSSLVEFINDLKAKRRKFPQFPDQLCRLALGFFVLSMIVFTDWFTILVFFTSTVGYFLLWWYPPENKGAEKPWAPQTN